MSQLLQMPLSELQENPWRPSASYGEARKEMQGTVDDWLARELPTTAKDDRDHGANFLRAAVKQFDREGYMEACARGVLEGECGPDSAALTWLWISTESLAKNALAALIVELAKAWRPCVQSPDFIDQVFQRQTGALEEAVQAAERFYMQSAMAREPRFDCADAQVPAAGDVLHDLEDDDLEDATLTSDGLVQLGRRMPGANV